MAEMTFTIPGNPVPKARARAGRFGAHYTPQRTREYERLVRLTAMANLPHGWRDDGEYTVTIAAHYSDRRSRDIDNVAKSILDGLNGVAWQDDSAVRRLVVDRYYSPDAPRADVTIEWRE